MGKATARKSGTERVIATIAATLRPAIEAQRPTAERMTHAHVEEFQVRDDAGHNTRSKGVRVCSRVEAMTFAGWWPRRSQAEEALSRYADLVEQCGYGNTKSCLDVRVPGHDDGRGSDRIAERKSTLVSVRNALCGHPDAIAALMTTDAMLWPAEAAETLTQTAMRIMACCERLATGRARPHVASIATALIGLMGVA